MHHIEHWENGGATDTPNLLCLCQHHHRLHHRGKLGRQGDADEPNAITFTDDRGRPLDRLRPAHATWERRAASRQRGAVQGRTAQSVGHLPERPSPAESRVRSVMLMAGAWETMLRNQTEHSGHPLSRHRLLVAHLDYAWHRASPQWTG
ncbi:MAG: HNH endonuclease [Actinomycetota bacterium]|nr:HNH endonuclease [Actinomycetota bacterium]